MGGLEVKGLVELFGEAGEEVGEGGGVGGVCVDCKRGLS